MEQALALLEHYGYIILFPIAIVEGPIIAVIAGFLTTLGFLNVWAVYALVVAADIVGDGLCYALGRYGKGPVFLALEHWFGVTEKKMDQMRKLAHAHSFKSIAVSKLFHGIGFVGIIALGALHFPYRKFFAPAATVSLLQDAAFVLVGVFFGAAYTRIEQYLNTFATAASAIFVAIVIFLVWKFGFSKK